MSQSFWKWKVLVVMGIVAIASAGCGQTETEKVDKTASPAVTQAVDDGGWWCVEHGVPEGECARCDASLVAKFKEAGDWCKEHNRPESQCFLCNPARFDQFAARYEAKFGAKPPKPTE